MFLDLSKILDTLRTPGGGWAVGGYENNANSAQLGLKTELDNIRVC